MPCDHRRRRARKNSHYTERATRDSESYQTVTWTGSYLQVGLMSIPVGESIGQEVHPETAQFLRLDAGREKCVMGSTRDHLYFEEKVTDGWSIQVPAGT
jgi:mannose-6-phosphate isomerase-like protein (cupin superfamily)